MYDGEHVENEAFCVKWGPNEDHFSSLVLIRTKSSIEDLFATTEYWDDIDQIEDDIDPREDETDLREEEMDCIVTLRPTFASSGHPVPMYT